MPRVNPLKFLGLAKSDASGGVTDSAPLGGTRSEAVQRLQVGGAGIGAMLLLVALANVIQNRARVTDEQAVPEAAPTTEPSAAQPVNDPLADAGIVPDLPVEPVPEPTQQAAPQLAPGQDSRNTTGAVEDVSAAEGT